MDVFKFCVGWGMEKEEEKEEATVSNNIGFNEEDRMWYLRLNK